MFTLVAPFAGAWIETGKGNCSTLDSKSRALRGRVDRNNSGGAPKGSKTSRALRGRVDRNDLVRAPMP